MAIRFRKVLKSFLTQAALVVTAGNLALAQSVFQAREEIPIPNGSQNVALFNSEAPDGVRCELRYDGPAFDRLIQARTLFTSITSPLQMALGESIAIHEWVEIRRTLKEQAGSPVSIPTSVQSRAQLHDYVKGLGLNWFHSRYRVIFRLQSNASGRQAQIVCDSWERLTLREWAGLLAAHGRIEPLPRP